MGHFPPGSGTQHIPGHWPGGAESLGGGCWNVWLTGASSERSPTFPLTWAGAGGGGVWDPLLRVGGRQRWPQAILAPRFGSASQGVLERGSPCHGRASVSGYPASGSSCATDEPVSLTSPQPCKLPTPLVPGTLPSGCPPPARSLHSSQTYWGF